MKTIPEIQFKDAGDLTPLQMNAIHFDTGDHSQYVGDTLAQAQRPTGCHRISRKTKRDKFIIML